MHPSYTTPSSFLPPSKHDSFPFSQSPPKGATIPYRPKPAVPPVIFAGGQAFTLQGQSDVSSLPATPTLHACNELFHKNGLILISLVEKLFHYKMAYRAVGPFLMEDLIRGECGGCFALVCICLLL